MKHLSNWTGLKLLAAGIGSGIALFYTVRSLHSLPSLSSPSPAASPSSAPAALRYTLESLPKSDIYTLVIPPGQFTVTTAIAPETATLETFAQQHQAIAVLNGGFFDPQNQLSTSYVIRQGALVADPRQNPRLINNPDLTPYLDQILNRSEFRRYRCESGIQYGIVLHSSPTPTGCTLLDALGAGPQLLPSLTLEQEGFAATASDGTVIRDALGSSQPNARTAVGLTQDGSVVWVMAAQKPNVSGTGVTLSELAALLKARGAVTALNLDGGSSSALFYQGTTHYGKIDAQGNRIQRPVKSVLVVQPNPEISSESDR